MRTWAEQKRLNKNLNLLAVFLAFAIFLIACSFLAGCGTVEPSLFTHDKVTGALKPNPTAVSVIQDTGAAFGPYGAAVAGLVTSGLSLFASLHNRRQFKRHVQETLPTLPTGPPPPT